MAAKDWIPAFAGMTEKAWGVPHVIPAKYHHVIPAQYHHVIPAQYHHVIPAKYHHVIPAQAGIYRSKDWIPAFAGMTK